MSGNELSLTGDTVHAEVVESLAQEAYERRRKGESVRQIAEDYQISQSSVYAAIERHMGREATQMPKQERESLLAMENERLDALQAAHWDQAMFGDPKSTEAILKIMALRYKVNQMDLVDPAAARGTSVLVVTGTEEEFVKSLRDSVEGKKAS